MSTTTEPPDKLDMIADEASSRLKRAIAEAHGDILAAWAQINEQAMEEEKNSVLKLSFAIIRQINAAQAKLDGAAQSLRAVADLLGTISVVIPPTSQASHPEGELKEGNS